MSCMKYSSDIHEESIWRCDCGGDHFLSVGLWKWEDEPYNGYIDITDQSISIVGNGISWRNLKGRLKGAWYVFRGRKHTWTNIMLSPKTCQEIIDKLVEVKKQLEEHGNKTE